jgi:hypothetical protein
MKKLLLAAAAPLLFVSPEVGLAQSIIVIGNTQIESVLEDQDANLVMAQQVTLSQAAMVNSMSLYVTVAQGRLFVAQSSGITF